MQLQLLNDQARALELCLDDLRVVRGNEIHLDRSDGEVFTARSWQQLDG